MSQVWVNFVFAMGENWVDFHLYCFSGPADVPVAFFGEWEILTEAQTKRQRRSRCARITRRLVPLARGASTSIDFSSRDHSPILLEQAFNDGMYQLKWGYFLWCFLNSLVFFCFRPLFLRCCHFAHQRDKSPVCQPLPFKMSTDSWPHGDKLVLLVFFVTCCFPFLYCL